MSAWIVGIVVGVIAIFISNTAGIEKKKLILFSLGIMILAKIGSSKFPEFIFIGDVLFAGMIIYFCYLLFQFFFTNN